MRFIWGLLKGAGSAASAYSTPIFAAAIVAAVTWTYFAGREHANEACAAEKAASALRAYEQGAEIARQNAVFDREVVTIVKEVQNETPVTPDGNRLTDDGLRRLNEYLNAPP